MSLQVCLYENILRHLYRDISVIIHLLLSLITSLRFEFRQSSLRASLQSKFLQSSLLVPLKKMEFYDYRCSHLYSNFCGIYSYDFSTKISLRSHLYRQNLKRLYRLLHIQNLKYFYKNSGICDCT